MPREPQEREAPPRYGISSSPLEAGGRLNGSLLGEGCVDELLVYLAPKLIGNTGLGMFDLPELKALSGAVALAITDVQRIGEDLRIMARLKKE